MTEGVRTSIYLGVAVVFVAAAVLVAHLTTPTPPEIYTKTGEPFYDDFEIENVTRLELSAIPDGDSTAQSFKLARAGNVWRLQSYHGYPAEAQERLAKTAASVMGLQREALVGQSTKEHGKFGVINPDDEEIDDPEDAGKRIRMLDAKGEVLFDLIVGKKAADAPKKKAPRRRPQPGAENEETIDDAKPRHYVRRPDENETYIAAISLDLSTKFSEWIEPDLLKLKQDDVRRLMLDNYSTKAKPVMTPEGRVKAVEPVNRETVELKRDTGFDPWKLDGLDEKKQSLKTDEIDNLLRVLAGMEILGVAPSYRAGDESPLRGDMKFEVPASVGKDPQKRFNVLRSLLVDLDKHGYSVPHDALDNAKVREVVQGTKPISFSLLSEAGDISVATKNGLVYHLHFGKEVAGSDKEIQFGGKPKAEPKKKAAKKKTDKKEPKAKKKEPADSATRRYVMIRVEYNEKYYENKPKKPVKPTPPKRMTIAARKPRRVRGPVAAPRPGGNHPAAVAMRPDPVARFYALQQDYRDAKDQYDRDLASYETDLKTFKENVKQARQDAERLNARFAGWYYVISTQNLKQLSLRRADLIGPKKKDPPAGKPKLPFGKLPGMR